MMGWSFACLGIPQPQGSKRAFVVNGRAIVTDDNRKTRPWRLILMDMMPDSRKLDGPIAVRMVFTMPRPASARKSDVAPCKKPDAIKLARAVEDAITVKGLWVDDSRVVEYSRLAKVWPGYDEHALREPGVCVAAVEMTGGWRDELAERFGEALAPLAAPLILV